MFAVTTTRPGGPEVLEWREVPRPVLKPGEVLIDVAASAVNRADLLQREGRYPPPPGASEILGLECSGTIVDMYDDVTGWQTGDQVCALLAGGGYAENVAVPAAHVLPVPLGIPVADAAALPEAACTVWSNLVLTAGLRQGQSVLIHGGSSGIGTMAIQVAKALGATVITTASRRAGLDLCRTLGADTVIDYGAEDFVAVALDATGGRGVDVILDVVGAKYLQRNVSALADGGRLVIIGMMGGRSGELDISALMARRASITGTQLRSRPSDGPGSKAEVVAAVRESLWPLIAAGRVAPVVGGRYGMDQAGEAHRALAAGETTGKLLLIVPDESGAH